VKSSIFLTLHHALHHALQCHRQQDNGKDIAYPVHSIVFHPVFGTFATGGGDGVINFWDGENKKRLIQISK
jgi:cell cycle arrest protein BUB3